MQGWPEPLLQGAVWPDFTARLKKIRQEWQTDRAPYSLQDIQSSHWSSSHNAALSLVESFRVVKYFHALKGPIIGALSVATPAVLCHKEPARRKNTPY